MFLSRKFPNKGFTLIELLVVISIISLLSSIVFSSLQDARARARDTQRISDMKQYQIAIEQSKKDGLLEGYAYVSTGGAGNGSVSNMLVNKGYLPQLIMDPVNNTGHNRDGYMYWNQGGHSWFEGDTDALTYVMRFRTESDSALGPPGYYCMNSKGFHAYSENGRCMQSL